MKLTLEERETIITFNERDKIAEVYTFNNRFKKQLNQLNDERGEVTKKNMISNDGVEIFEIPKSWVKIRAKRILTEEEKEEIKKRFNNY